MKTSIPNFRFLGSIVIALLLSINTSAQMKLHFIDVGQGSACLVEFPCGAILVDAGGEKNTDFDSNEKLKAYLSDFFDRRADLKNTLQCFYITHPHIDHTRGVPTILEAKYKIKNLVTNGMETGSGKAQQTKMHKLVDMAEATPTKTDNIGFVAVSVEELGKAGLTNKVIDPINCSGVDPSIKVLWGEMIENPGISEKEFYNENNNSLVIKIEYGDASILFTGDLEESTIPMLIEKYNGTNVLDADVYVSGHHGSKNGTTVELLDKITPDYAVISMGDVTRELSWTAWAYGHPNKDVLDILQTKVKQKRKKITIQAGDGAKKFVDYTIDKAIYATGWDEDIVVVAESDGSWSFNGSSSFSRPSKLDINVASKSELIALPGIGEKKAQAILDNRKKVGAYNTIEDVAKVPGISIATIELIGPHIKFK